MRTVLTVDGTGDIDAVHKTEKLVVKVERYPDITSEMRQVRPLDLSPAELPDWSQSHAVINRGKLLRAALNKHSGIADVLKTLSGNGAGVRPLYLKLSHGDAEAIPWESLCNNQDEFLALDSRWPIGRMTDPAEVEPRTPPLMSDPIRLIAVISALGVADQLREWEHLRVAIADGWQNGVRTYARVLTGHPAVYDAIQKDVLEMPLVEVESLVGTGIDLRNQIRGFKPNIVHLFCHGSVDSGAQRLEFATSSDFLDPKAQTGSVVLTEDDVIRLSYQLDNPWLLTLNCCEGAKAGDGMTSLAHRAVAAGFNAAIAMLEPIDASDAYLLTHHVYPALFAKLEEVIEDLEKGQWSQFEWAPLMNDVRGALNKEHNSDAENHREWVLPTLYVRGVDQMHFERRTPLEPHAETSSYRFLARMVADWLLRVRDTMPPEKRTFVVRKVLKDVPERYWPNIDGMLDGLRNSGRP